MGKYDVMTVAHWFLWRNEFAMNDKGAENLSLLQLMKLLYYAEGCYLALHNGEKLFDAPIVAWEHGPAIEIVFNAYADPYVLPFSEQDREDGLSVSKEDQALLEQVFNVFGAYSAWALRDKSIAEVPWLEATDGGQRLNGEINQDTMQKYFAAHYVIDAN